MVPTPQRLRAYSPHVDSQHSDCVAAGSDALPNCFAAWSSREAAASLRRQSFALPMLDSGLSRTKMTLPLLHLTPFLVATSFAAGLNAYATVATLGLLARFELISLSPRLSLLTNWYVIGACLVLFLIEFVADKIPVFDLLWNALHTFVRPPIAALLAYGAASQLPPEMQLLSAFLGGAIALAAHGGKTAARAVVTPSPEPLSNFALSMGEDSVAIFLTWFATTHPYWAAAIAALGLVAVVVAFKYVLRTLRSLFQRTEQVLK